MASQHFLDQSDEDSLHAARLLNVEEKLLKRVTKRLLTPGSLITAPQDTLPTPPPEASADNDAGNDDKNEEAATATAKEKEVERRRQDEERRKWREDVLLDFEAFDSNVVRAQLLLNSNERERSRYAQEKVRILETAQAVRDTNAALHEQLKAAQRTLEVRKGYDALARKITSNRMLKPREEQHAQLDKLNAEIAELERESQEYAATWAERREQFGKIVEEGMQMLRLIRDEKEEAERKEGMEGMDATEEISREGTSQAGTPAGGATPAHVTEVVEKSSPSHGSKLKDELMGVDDANTQESRAVSPLPLDSRAPSGDAQESQMTNEEETATESGASTMKAKRDDQVESDMDKRQSQTSGPDQSAVETPRIEFEAEQMDTT